MEHNAEGTQTRKLAELIKDIRVAMFISSRAGGEPHARPMYALGVDPDSFDGDMWFFSDASAVKLMEIQMHPAVMLTMADEGKNRYLALYGDAAVEENPSRAEHLWSIHARAWWPQGPMDPNLAIIRVNVRSAEYWDGPSNASYFLSLAKAVIKHERIETKGLHGEVTL